MKAKKIFLVLITFTFSRTQKFQCLIIGLGTSGLSFSGHRFRGIYNSLGILPKCI